MMTQQSQRYQSGGESEVVVRGTVAYQVFRRPAEFQHVVRVARAIAAATPIHVFWSDGTLYTYTPLEHHAQMIGASATIQTIQWERMVCLNQLPADTVQTRIRNHLHRFLWDILKGLFGLHAYGYSQGDVCLDNIAFRNHRYVLFDYNLSRASSADTISRDLHALIRSIRFHFHALHATEDALLDHVKQISSLEEYLVYVQRVLGLASVLETAEWLDRTSLPEPPQYADNQHDYEYADNDLNDLNDFGTRRKEAPKALY